MDTFSIEANKWVQENQKLLSEDDLKTFTTRADIDFSEEVFKLSYLDDVSIEIPFKWFLDTSGMEEIDFTQAKIIHHGLIVSLGQAEYQTRVLRKYFYKPPKKKAKTKKSKK